MANTSQKGQKGATQKAAANLYPPQVARLKHTLLPQQMSLTDNSPLSLSTSPPEGISQFILVPSPRSFVVTRPMIYTIKKKETESKPPEPQDINTQSPCFPPNFPKEKMRWIPPPK